MTVAELIAQLEFSHREREVLKELADKQDLTEFQVLRQALRTYQLVATGHSRLVEVRPLPKYLDTQ